MIGWSDYDYALGDVEGLQWAAVLAHGYESPEWRFVRDINWELKREPDPPDACRPGHGRVPVGLPVPDG